MPKNGTLMKHIILTIVFFGVCVFALTPARGQYSKPTAKDSLVEAPRLLLFAEQMPFLPGGERLSNEQRRLQVINAAQSHLVLPVGFKRPKRSAKIFVSFVITPQAKIADVKVIHTDEKLNKNCMDSAVAAVQSLVGFTAGFEKGRPVFTSVVIPFEFGIVSK